MYSKQYKTSIECYKPPEDSPIVYSTYYGHSSQFPNSNDPVKFEEDYQLKYKDPECPSYGCPQPQPVPPKPDQDLDMKIQTKHYATTTDPAVWGPSFWFSLHNGASKYPVNASPFISSRMKKFILGIPIMLPCETCKIHAYNHIEKNYEKLDEITSGREKLFEFFVDFHNYVNVRYGKPKISVEQAKQIYDKGVNIQYITYK